MFTFIMYFPDVTFLQTVLNPSSQQADKIFWLFNYFNIGTGVILLLVIFLVFYICIKFRRKTGDTENPLKTKGNKKREALMMAVPVLLVGFFFYHTVNTMREVSPSVDAGRQPDVIITRHQWWWEVKYSGMTVVTADEVHLPIGKNLLMEMGSGDVIHDWWIPELGNKKDLVPETQNYIWLDINKPGTYNGVCSEFWGVQHVSMRIKVIAQKENDFTRWLIENAKNAQKSKDSLAFRETELFQRNTFSCWHRVNGINAVYKRRY